MSWALTESRYISAEKEAVEVPGIEGSKRDLSFGVGTVLPVALAVRLMTKSVSSTAADTSAAEGTRSAAAGCAVANPIQQFSLGIRVDICGSFGDLRYGFDGMGSACLNTGYVQRHVVGDSPVRRVCGVVRGRGPQARYLHALDGPLDSRQVDLALELHEQCAALVGQRVHQGLLGGVVVQLVGRDPAGAQPADPLGLAGTGRGGRTGLDHGVLDEVAHPGLAG